MKWLALLSVALLTVAAIAFWHAEQEPLPAPVVESLPTQPDQTPGTDSSPVSVSPHAPIQTNNDISSVQLVQEIERALVSVDDKDRDRVYLQLLPELIARDASAAARLVEKAAPGQVRTELLGHVARLWSASDLDGAIKWASNLKDDAERTSAATEMTTQLARTNPGNAIELANLFDIGHDNGSVEHMAQIWATENLDAALKWIHAQPPGPRRDQVLARVVVVQAARDPANAAETASRQLTPGPARDEAVLGIVRQWAHRDPEAAATWVEKLANSALRDRARTELAWIAQQRRSPAQ